MRKRVKMVKNDPMAFKGSSSDCYFEGWYFKQVSADEKTVLSFIPSFSRVKNQEKAIIQVILAQAIERYYDAPLWATVSEVFPFHIKLWDVENQDTIVKIENNSFGYNFIDVNLESEKVQVKGKIEFSKITPLPSSILQPDIMGFFSYLPFLQCYHGIGSMNHEINGFLEINSKEINFNGGKAYLEKDRGKSFPEYYVWLQSNHFTEFHGSLFFSWAKIPMGVTSFDGFLCNLWTGKEHIRFATYNGSKCNVKINQSQSVEILLENKEYILSISGSENNSTALLSPQEGEMDHFIKESLTGTLSFNLYNKNTKSSFKANSPLAGIEIGIPKAIDKTN